MLTPEQRRVIEESRKLISDPEHWTQQELAKNRDGSPCEPTDSTAYCWCAHGALLKTGCNGSEAGVEVAEECLNLVSRKARALFMGSFGEGIVSVNDGTIGLPQFGTAEECYEIAHTNTLQVFDAVLADG